MQYFTPGCLDDINTCCAKLFLILLPASILMRTSAAITGCYMHSLRAEWIDIVDCVCLQACHSRRQSAPSFTHKVHTASLPSPEVVVASIRWHYRHHFFLSMFSKLTLVESHCHVTSCRCFDDTITLRDAAARSPHYRRQRHFRGLHIFRPFSGERDWCDWLFYDIFDGFPLFHLIIAFIMPHGMPPLLGKEAAFSLKDCLPLREPSASMNWC